VVAAAATKATTVEATAAVQEVATTSAAEALRSAGRPDHRAAGARLSELFARHGAAVLGLCRLLLRHREEAEDAVQQTFLAAYRSLLNGTEPRHPAAWLATIARNECWGRIRQRMREPLREPQPEGGLPDPVAAAAARADLEALWRAIAELPVQQREALLLREFSGLSYAELAQALGVSEPAVESLLFRARRGLRARLRPAYGSVAGIAPLAAIREALARAIGGMPDPATAGALAKLASAPLLVKLAAGATVFAVAGGTVAEIERDTGPSSRPARAGVAKPALSAIEAQGAVKMTAVASVQRLPRESPATEIHVARPEPRPTVFTPARIAVARPASDVAPSAAPDPVEIEVEDPPSVTEETATPAAPVPSVPQPSPTGGDRTTSGENEAAGAETNGGSGSDDSSDSTSSESSPTTTEGEDSGSGPSDGSAAESGSTDSGSGDVQSGGEEAGSTTSGDSGDSGDSSSAEQSTSGESSGSDSGDAVSAGDAESGSSGSDSGHG
jgi:RNA polymerase sigma factor (sigma-70 family)